MNEMPVFKSFLREQLENQKELEKAIKEKNLEKAEELIEKMIDRTQKGIEDNQKRGAHSICSSFIIFIITLHPLFHEQP